MRTSKQNLKAFASHHDTMSQRPKNLTAKVAKDRQGLNSKTKSASNLFDAQNMNKTFISNAFEREAFFMFYNAFFKALVLVLNSLSLCVSVVKTTFRKTAFILFSLFSFASSCLAVVLGRRWMCLRVRQVFNAFRFPLSIFNSSLTLTPQNV